MSFTLTAVIKFTNTKNCFISVPKNWTYNLGEPPVNFKLEPTTHVCERRYHYVTWSGGVSKKPDEIEINGIFGEKLRLVDGSQVRLEKVSHVLPSCDLAKVSTMEEADWEIMELNSQIVENSMLNQIKIVTKNLVFPVWVGNNRFCFRVDLISPNNEALLLTSGSEIKVAPNKWKKLQDEVLRKNQDTANSAYNKSQNVIVSNIIKTVFKTFTSGASSNEPSSAVSAWPNECLPFNLEISLRVGSSSCCIPNENETSTTDVYVTEESLLPYFYPMNSIPRTFVARLSKILSPSERSRKKATDAPLKTSSWNKTLQENNFKISPVTENAPNPIFEVSVVRVRVMSMRFNSENSVLNSRVVYVSDSLRKQLGLEISSVVCLQSIRHSASNISALEVQPLKSLRLKDFSLELFTTALTSQLMLIEESRNPPPVVSLGMLFHLIDIDFVWMGSFSSDMSDSDSPKEEQYFYLSQSLLKNTRIAIGSKTSPVFKSWDVYLPCSALDDLEPKPVGVQLQKLGGVSEITTQILNALEFSLSLTSLANHLSCYSSGKNYLVTGSKGVGKSVVCRAICQSLWDSFRVFTRVVDCKQLRGKRADSIKKIWEEACAEAVHRRPSVLLFDDLDTVASATRPEQEASPDSLYFGRITDVFANLMRSLEALGVKVSILATSRSTKSLHPLLSRSAGKNVFLSTFELLPPNLLQREDILKSLIRNKNYISPLVVNNVPLLEIAKKMEGYVAQDLVSVVDKAIHAHALDNKEVFDGDCMFLDKSDFYAAIKEFTPNCLRSLSLHVERNNEWKDVGGLSLVKETLQQTLTWPIKYAKLFSKCSLRPASGVLLYGAPGTGKTLLAGVVASQCGQNFISIKGPELLSKYIGASEQSVRDVFARAQSAKPCIVFFDEFDAIAPRRGHDSTGVTDRVVNQLLTQLDGVESLSGVSVLAASSRPDLIDPALLRPGRFDKCLHCPLPDELDRLEILQSLSGKLGLDSEVSLKVIAQATEHFSGADLQALLYTAQLVALDEALTRKSKKKDDDVGEAALDNVIVFPKLGSERETLSTEKKRKLFDEVSVMASSMRDFSLKDARESDKGQRRRSSCCAPPVITPTHVQMALAKTKPSVSEKERAKYSAIYEMFQKSRSGKLSSHSAQPFSKRVTLA